ncbi:tyrosine-type recombinase/integrase [Streptomyces hygroscopicus]|uniref:tyrosine-type recombinase/integrase n=1 Tax=Streptomyces hygroscopicus TaxID=1912 RepID=UPI000824DDD4|nr:site-specific integrase [Streptomyces hygroscopicus]
MTVPSLLPQQDARTGRDRLEVLTALINAPSFDPLFRPDLVKIPLNHPVYRWNCLAADCERGTMGHCELCSTHEMLWREHRGRGGSRAEFLRTAPPVGPGEGVEQRICQICPERPARHLTLGLCHYHEYRWYHHRDRYGDDADFDAWLVDQHTLPGFGDCRVRVCTELADSPLGLCYRHERRYRKQGSPGGASRPSQWGNRYGRRGLVAPVSYEDEHAFHLWCAAAPAVFRPAQVNLRGLSPLLRAEIQWSMFTHTQRPHGRWELITWQGLASFAREHGLRSLTETGPEEERLLQKAVSRQAVQIVRAVVGWLQPLYVTPDETRELGYILTEHFGRKITGRSVHMDLTGVSQRWLRDLIWDHLVGNLRSPSCPRSGRTFDDMRRAGLELSTFLELRAPAGGHDPQTLTAEHMHQFVADQRQRERDGLASLAARGLHGKPSIVTANTRTAVFHRTRRLLRRALESGEAERLGLDRAFITAMPAPGRAIVRSRPPFSDGVARALANEANLRRLAQTYDPFDRGLRDAWETIIVTGRRCGEVLQLRLDCLGRYGGLPMLWHDQTKVGNYDQALRIPERVHQLLETRQHKTLALFEARNNRPPTAEERARMALFPTNIRNRDGRRPLTYKWFHKGFKLWIDDLEIGRWVPHQARHSLATSLLRAGATLTHVRRYLGHVSERMAEHYVHLTQSDLEDVLQHVWVAGPGTAKPGELLTETPTPLTREQAQSLAIDLSRRSTPAEGGFCTFQPVVDGGACPWNLDCHNCDKFVLSGADLLYWRRKREQWRLLAEGAPDDATADYLHRYFEPTARAIDGLEKALAGLGLLDDALALDLRKPQDYFHRVWSTAFRAADLADAGTEEESEYSDTCTTDNDSEQDIA